MQSIVYSPEQVVKIGENFYFQELKEKLEKEHMGEYVVIDVERKEYIINKDKLTALEDAKEKFGDRLFHIIQIGSIQRQVFNYKNSSYDWKF